MPIQYKMRIIHDNLNPDPEKKKTMYPVVVRKITINREQLCDFATTNTSLNETEVDGSLKQIIREIKRQLLSSNHVCIDGFGTFSLSLGTKKEVEHDSELRAPSIYVKHLHFIPSKKFLLSLSAAARFVKV